MVDENAKDGEGDSSTKASVGGESGVRKLTLSCSRCRASKLKCDKTEPCVCCHLLMPYSIDLVTNVCLIDGMCQA